MMLDIAHHNVHIVYLNFLPDVFTGLYHVVPYYSL